MKNQIKTKRKKIVNYVLLLLVGMMTSMNLLAADFTVNGIAYNITDTTAKEVEVTQNSYTGNISIPASVTNAGVTYSVTAIGKKAFSWCYGLKQITIPNSVTTIGLEAFAGCTSLNKFIVDPTNPNYSSKDDVLFNKDQSTLIKYPIGSSYTTYTVPNNVTTIGISAFSDCTVLKEITIPNSVTSIRGSAFSGCKSLAEFIVASTNPNYSSKDGVLFNKNQTTLIQYTVGNSRTTYNIPNSVTTIGESAFYYCSDLTQITIGSNVTTIGNYAFFDCSGLTQITIPNSVISMGNGAFSYCSGLERVSCLVADPKNITMGNDVFKNVPVQFDTLYVPKGSKSLYEIADQWKEFQSIIEVEFAGIKYEDLSNLISLSGKNITISGVEYKSIRLYDINGKLLINIHSSQETITLTAPRTGIYIVQVETSTRKILVIN